MTDFRHITDYVWWYCAGFVSHNKPATKHTITGVKVNCLGEQKMLRKPPFEAVELPATDPVFSHHCTSDIAGRIGIPVFIGCRCTSRELNSGQYDSVFGGSALHNQAATFLHLCCDPEAGFDPKSGSMSWGWAPQQWRNGAGNIIIVRQDKKPLLPLHAEALCDYAQN